MRILFLGDVVGRTGREAVAASLPRLRAALGIDLAVVNAENASHGFGLSPEIARMLFAAGADVLTLGNHAWDRKEIIPYIAETPRLIRPLNYPPGTPGAGSVAVQLPDGRRALVLNAMGRLFMDALDCPFRGTAAELAQSPARRLRRRHRGRFPRRGDQRDHGLRPFLRRTGEPRRRHAHPLPDGRPPGPAGRHRASSATSACAATMTASSGCRRTARRPASGAACRPSGCSRRRARRPSAGCIVETDDATGRARRIEPIRQGGRLAPTLPAV